VTPAGLPGRAGSAALALAPLLHSHTSDREWLSVALWAGLALALAAALVAALLIGARLLARRAAQRRRPCAECGYFFDQSGKGVCPQCGLRPPGLTCPPAARKAPPDPPPAVRGT